MTNTATFDSPRVFTGGIEDWMILGVLLLASVLAQVFLIQRNRHPDNVHSPPLAWLRAALYFCVVLVLSWATGVLKVLVHAPCVQPGQLADPLWLGLTALWTVATVWGYVYWWPRGTLTHDRKLYLVPQVLFGLAWGSPPPSSRWCSGRWWRTSASPAGSPPCWCSSCSPATGRSTSPAGGTSTCRRPTTAGPPTRRKCSSPTCRSW